MKKNLILIKASFYLPLQEYESGSKEIMSLPMNPYVSDDEISYIATIL